ncbi:hypothetical protein Stsp02_11570 [Streptomyces sp. NBRC 14336]|uniref:hypothetical protein n=1 Tax=Streptomyces sp. NBRC 14336 TaxID=3030992 RepID=UPI0024A234F6|nr:hypothetical protein [Streptomyces sp. NBRC 14336]GLW45495.1 hypothetical protein Stsp02_11570 [Streptomyces sp. NBRC 14336]
MIPADPTRPYVVSFVQYRKEGPTTSEKRPVLAWDKNGVPMVPTDTKLTPATELGSYTLHPAPPQPYQPPVF